MKKYLNKIFVLLLPFFLISPALAATYPSTCPAEAQAVVIAVGGCSAISQTQYGAIYSKCCSAGATQTPKTNGSVKTGNSDQSLVDTLSAKYPNTMAPTTTSESFFSWLIVIACLILFVFWIWMIVDVARRKISISNKILWLLVILLLNWLGALVYYLVIKRPETEKEKQI